jgi:ABC-type sugar transport system ATPase subunit
MNFARQRASRGCGAIRAGGQDVTRLSPERRNIAMVFQSYALWPHMTVAQNIGYGLKLRHIGRAEIDARIDELLAMLRLDGLGERKVTALSGGQRQRVALGRALAISPQVLLLDESLSNLDARIREDVRHEIKTLQQRLVITTVHVTHDRQEAMVMADRIAILDAGRIAQIGTPEEIYNRPVSPFVANFMGAANIVVLRLRCDGKGLALEHEALGRRVAIDPAVLPIDRDAGCQGTVSLNTHFRREDARLCDPSAVAEGCLVLRGEIVQCSYPGGFYRYAVRVGAERQYLVDDERRLPLGDAVGIALPLTALHFYPATQRAD